MHTKLSTNQSKLKSTNISSAMHTTNMKLTIELVPMSSWYSNVRSNVSKAEWDRLRHKSYEQANHVCEICGDIGTNQGYRHKLECHEIWDYDDVNLKQTLTGLISLCPYCHTVKHTGLAITNGKLELVIEHLMNVNNLTSDQAVEYIEESFKIWRERNKKTYSLDISFLDDY
jgi:5-methylcytosine-specific restriction endonuclease McrA